MAQQARREKKTIDNRFSGADRSTESRNGKKSNLCGLEEHVLTRMKRSGLQKQRTLLNPYMLLWLSR